MIVKNETANTLVLSDKATGFVRLRPKGGKDSFARIGEEWKKSLVLEKHIRAGYVTVEENDEYPTVPQEPDALSSMYKYQQTMVRQIVLGTDDEYEANIKMQPMRNSSRSPDRVNYQAIREKFLPALGVAQEWLVSLVDSGIDGPYKKRLAGVEKRQAEFRKMLQDQALDI